MARSQSTAASPHGTRAPRASGTALIALPQVAPQCEGSAHAHGTYGHDKGPARFKLRECCPDCGYRNEVLVCAGRARSMRRSGISCDGCGVVHNDLSRRATLDPLEKQPVKVPALKAVPDSARVGDAFAQEQRARGFVETTISNRLCTVAALEAFVKKPALTIATNEILEYLGRREVKRSTRRSNQAALKAFYRFASNAGYLDVDPAASLPPIRVARGKPRPFTVDQINQMLTSGAYRRTRAMILLGFHQGFRVSQIARVHGQDVDLVANTIRTLGKGGRTATLPLHDVVAELALSMPRQGWWFPATEGRPGHIRSSSVSDAITEAKRRAGITDPRLTPHSLRHAFGTELVEAGVDIRVVQELMMHEDLSTTQIYTGVSVGRQTSAIAALPSSSIPHRSGRPHTANTAEAPSPRTDAHADPAALAERERPWAEN